MGRSFRSLVESHSMKTTQMNRANCLGILLYQNVGRRAPALQAPPGRADWMVISNQADGGAHQKHAKKITLSTH